MLFAWLHGSAASKKIHNIFEYRKTEREKEALRLEHGRALVAGQMHPDEFLPPPQSLVWTESGYELVESDSSGDGR